MGVVWGWWWMNFWGCSTEFWMFLRHNSEDVMLWELTGRFLVGFQPQFSLRSEFYGLLGNKYLTILQNHSNIPWYHSGQIFSWIRPEIWSKFYKIDLKILKNFIEVDRKLDIIRPEFKQNLTVFVKNSEKFLSSNEPHPDQTLHNQNSLSKKLWNYQTKNSIFACFVVST